MTTCIVESAKFKHAKLCVCAAAVMERGELEAIKAEAVQLIESHIDLSEALTEVSM